MRDVAPTSIADLVTALSTGRLGLPDYIDDLLSYIEHWEVQIRAFTHLDRRGAREQARELATAARRGEPMGPLFGVPIGVKDLIDVRGMPTRAGSQVTLDTIVERDAPVVARLRAAGAIILGKTTTHEFAYGVTTPPTRNPWDFGRIAGGSSGGSAAAVAAGECVAAIGTDTGGSVRVPAALCGVSGLRPSWGDIPTEGCIPFSPRLDTCGPLARSARDLALLHRILSGKSDPGSRVPGAISVGVLGERSLGDVEPDVALAVAEAAEVLAAVGCHTTQIEIPPLASWGEARNTYMLGELLDGHRRAGWYPARRDLYGADIRYYLELAETISSEQRRGALERLAALQREFEAAVVSIDCLLLPTVVATAPTVEDADRSTPGGLRPVVGRLIQLCGPFSWCGMAAISVPCGLSRDGLPIGLQLVGRDTQVVLAVAELFQQGTRHHLDTPPMDSQHPRS